MCFPPTFAAAPAIKTSSRRCARAPKRCVEDERADKVHWPVGSSSTHRFGALAHRLDDVLIAGAAAKVGGKHIEEVFVADVRLAFNHAHSQHQKTGRAEAALQTMMIHEGLLHWVERLAVRETFDRADLLTLRLHREHQAGPDRFAFHDHGAGSADAVLAADMRAGLAAFLADSIREGTTRLDRDVIVATVDRKGDVDPFTRTHLCSRTWAYAAKRQTRARRDARMQDIHPRVRRADNGRCSAFMREPRRCEEARGFFAAWPESRRSRPQMAQAHR